MACGSWYHHVLLKLTSSLDRKAKYSPWLCGSRVPLCIWKVIHFEMDVALEFLRNTTPHNTWLPHVSMFQLLKQSLKCSKVLLLVCYYSHWKSILPLYVLHRFLCWRSCSHYYEAVYQNKPDSQVEEIIKKFKLSTKVMLLGYAGSGLI